MKLKNPEVTLGKIREQLSTYIKKYQLKALVIGESGGIDSALCSALAGKVCKDLGIQLIGRSISIETNKADEIERGKQIGQAFCTDFHEISLTDLYHQQVKDIEEVDSASETEREKKIRLGNVKARMRMIYLYNLAQKHKGIVLSTDNITEFLLGFWTLHGDVGDYGMIQGLWKTEVYELAQYMVENAFENENQKAALQACIDAIPTDGLGITSSDLEQLQADSYYEVDEMLISYLADKHSVDNKHPVIQRHLRSAYKRNNPFNLKREDIL
ncbi:MAG: NAD(+) synthase [Salinivirgaceae bacterium]|nr:NAD(+) synthase [Salinivirgaceae bacterium]